ncbi:MAG TPA: GGDEF domain-containing protein [Candidatus Saccharimonadales bacterium]|nr:GGDEF domain-containing protein [Candidatus Saccharimonadales bacterium]
MDTPDQAPPQRPQGENVIDLIAASEAAKGLIGLTPEPEHSSLPPEMTLGFKVASIKASEEGAPSNEAKLLSKKDWHKRVDELDQEATKHALPLSILFADVDRFKEVNDTLGHQAGDDLIEQVRHMAGSSLRTNSDNRRNDSVSAGEMGGDEIAAVVIGDEKVAALIEERWRNAFNELLSLPENTKLKDLKLNLSVGRATRQPNAAMTASELLRAADEAMYKNKVEQLPELKRRQKAALYVSSFILKKMGIRLRDLPKYEHVQKVRKLP